MLIINLKTKQQSLVKRLSEAVTHFSQTVMGALLNFIPGSPISHTQGHYPASSKNIPGCSWHFPLETCSFSPAHFPLQRVWLVGTRKQEWTGVPRLPSICLYSEHPLRDLDPTGREQSLGLEANLVPHLKLQQDLVRPTGETPLVITGSWVCVPGHCCILNKLYRFPG